MTNILRWTVVLFAVSAVTWRANADEPKLNEPKLNLPDLGIPGLSGGSNLSSGSHVKFSANLTLAHGQSMGLLSVTAVMDPGWHIYSLTQKKGGAAPSKLEVAESPKYRIVGQFTATPKPKVVPPGGPNPFDVSLEEHGGEVTWNVPIEFSPGANPETDPVRLRYSGQVCQDEGVCIPIKWTPIAVAYQSTDAPQKETPPSKAPLTDSPQTDSPQTRSKANEVAPRGETRYRAPRTNVTLTGNISPAKVRPGGRVKVSITATPESLYHVYALERTDSRKSISKPTLITFEKSELAQLGQPIPHKAPLAKETGLPEQPIAHVHKSAVTWTAEFNIPEAMSFGPVSIQGLMGYQACTDRTCDNPTGAAFSGSVQIGDKDEEGVVPLTFAKSSYSQASKLALESAGEQARSPAAPVQSRPSEVKASATENENATAGSSNQSPPRSDSNSLAGKSVIVVLALAFLGGLILNVMPCVLPVIGLKVMSFVQQAGESRFRIFYLNLWFSLGLLSVFWVLASVAVAFSIFGMGTFGWAEQFQIAGFNIGLAAVVFVFALSFLGVWEIPIPGFVGGSVANQMAAREGAVGAYLKGVLATVLATPCTGPLMGPAISWAVVQPAHFTYLVFTFLGLGMASPFLLIGLFPRLIRMIPKPGQWMVTFKQFMGFVLMGTVVWLFYALQKADIVRALIFLLGLGMACWLIGMVDITAPFSQKLRGWSRAVALACLFWFLAFGPIFSAKSHLQWVPFDRVSLDQHLAAGRPVLVDFTADW